MHHLLPPVNRGQKLEIALGRTNHRDLRILRRNLAKTRLPPGKINQQPIARTLTPNELH